MGSDWLGRTRLLAACPGFILLLQSSPWHVGGAQAGFWGNGLTLRLLIFSAEASGRLPSPRSVRAGGGYISHVVALVPAFDGEESQPESRNDFCKAPRCFVTQLHSACICDPPASHTALQKS